ncbi:hypothetical protein C7212DRAFT_341990 [Tuber magnatum]|uniref:Uncharacterized protein n=1 Tax=Tuber magnatum TaxID=42249 RepID=A0A317T3F3_9PEZI|nr:hypothetical protein C7212DRAFT_341990 [Tuber magnatum]
MPVYGEDKERELHQRLSAYMRGGANCNNADDLEIDTPGSPDSLFDAHDPPGPSNIASAFAAGASNSVLARSRSTRSTRSTRSRGLPEIEAQVEEAGADNDGWTSTDSTASRAGSVHPDADFAPGAGGARRAGYGGGGRSAAGGARPVGIGMGREDAAPGEPNPIVIYKCWSCGATVSLRRKGMLVMCPGCGGRIVMKVKSEK